MDEINVAVSSMDEMTQKNAALVEETSAAAEAMSSQAADLREMMAFFRCEKQAVAASAAGLASKTPKVPVSRPAMATAGRSGAAVRTQGTAAHYPAGRRSAGVKPALPAKAGRASESVSIASPKVQRGGALKHAKNDYDEEWKEF